MIQIEMDRPMGWYETEAADDPLVVTPRKAAVLLGVPVQTLAAWRCRGDVQIPYVKMGRHVRYRMSDLRAYLRANVRGVAQ